MDYLKLVRFHNLLIIIAVLCIARYSVFMIEDISITLSDLGFLFLTLATALIAAGGYIINDTYNITTDKINKPKNRIVEVTITQKQAKLLYFITTFSGLGFGFILTNLMERPSYFIVFVVSAGMLYVYARRLRKYAILGNVIISLLSALTVLLVAIFELLPAISEGNREQQIGVLSLVISVAIFTSAITFVRELVKDIVDIQGDHVAGYKTLPIILGARRTARFSVILILLFITCIAWYTFTFLYDYKLAVAFVFFGLIAPLGFACSRLWEADKKSELSRISFILKITLLLGICSIPILIYAIYNA